MSAQHKEIVRKVNDAFASNQIERFLEHCAEDVKFGMVGDKTVQGKDAVRQWMKSMDGRGAPELHPTDLIAEGEMVASLGTMKMKEKDGHGANQANQ